VSTFFALSAWALLRSRTVRPWVPLLGLLTAALGYIGMFRNVTTSVAPVAMLNNYLLPLWMVIFGVVLLRHRPAPDRARHDVMDVSGNAEPTRS
jgi:drug/metabolite transporter (DMT)-like permease